MLEAWFRNGHRRYGLRYEEQDNGKDYGPYQRGFVDSLLAKRFVIGEYRSFST
jgi:hypothetical protein